MSVESENGGLAAIIAHHVVSAGVRVTGASKRLRGRAVGAQKREQVAVAVSEHEDERVRWRTPRITAHWASPVQAYASLRSPRKSNLRLTTSGILAVAEFSKA